VHGLFLGLGEEILGRLGGQSGQTLVGLDKWMEAFWISSRYSDTPDCSWGRRLATKSLRFIN